MTKYLSILIMPVHFGNIKKYCIDIIDLNKNKIFEEFLQEFKINNIIVKGIAHTKMNIPYEIECVKGLLFEDYNSANLFLEEEIESFLLIKKLLGEKILYYKEKMV